MVSPSLGLVAASQRQGQQVGTCNPIWSLLHSNPFSLILNIHKNIQKSWFSRGSTKKKHSHFNPQKFGSSVPSMLANQAGILALKLLSQWSLGQTIPSLSLVVRPCPCVAASSVPRFAGLRDRLGTQLCPKMVGSWTSSLRPFPRDGGSTY